MATSEFSQSMFDRVALERTVVKYGKNDDVFSQGGPCDAIFYVVGGQVKLTVVSDLGKEAIIAILQPGAFFGEQCLAGHPLRIATATALGDTSLIRIEKAHMLRVLSEQREFSDFFLNHLLSRTARYEEDLIDQLFNSSEKRLARILLLLANFGKEGKSEPVLGNISQETLAEMVGTTRSRVSHFMNKFRKLGFIEYNGKLLVNSSLLHVVLNEKRTVEDDQEPEPS
jgi:CRP/FNR family cyclic AMP-dependent transcriptional regulator